MARYNEMLVGRFNRALQKLLQMKGEPPAPQLSTEVTPNISFPLGTEFRYLEQWNRFAISGNIVEVGGVTGTRFRLRNPSTSNVVGVVEFIAIASSVNEALLIFLGTQTADLPTVLTGQRLDRRIQAATGALIPSTDTSGAPDSPQIMRIVVPANQSVQLIGDAIQELTILPGDGLAIDSVTVAVGTALGFSIIWRERFLEESERA